MSCGIFIEIKAESFLGIGLDPKVLKVYFPLCNVVVNKGMEHDKLHTA